MRDDSSFLCATGTVRLTETNILKFQLDDLQRSISERRNMINHLIDQVARNYAEDLLSRMAESSVDSSSCDSGDNYRFPTKNMGSVCLERSDCLLPAVSRDMGEAQHRILGPGSRPSGTPAPKKCGHGRKKSRKGRNKVKKLPCTPHA